MKIITYEDIKKLNISPLECYKWATEMIANKRNTILPPKISLSPKEGVFCNTMPCILNEKWGGVKIVNRYPDRKTSLDSKLVLMDNETGDFLAYMDANWITAMRTGAVAAHSIMTFAKSDWTTVGMMGLGNTCRATLLVLASIINNKKITVKLLKYKQQEKSFIERLNGFDNINFIYVDEPEQLVRGTDVVVSCVTYFKDDLCKDEWFDEGVLVVPVHTRGFTNCDLFFDKVFADDYNHVKHFKYFDKFKYFAEVCDVVNKTSVGRENDKERILAYNIGLSIHDVNYAAHIYELLKNNSDILEVDMGDPVDKFWI